MATSKMKAQSIAYKVLTNVNIPFNGGMSGNVSEATLGVPINKVLAVWVVSDTGTPLWACAVKGANVIQVKASSNIATMTATLNVIYML